MVQKKKEQRHKGSHKSAYIFKSSALWALSELFLPYEEFKRRLKPDSTHTTCKRALGKVHTSATPHWNRHSVVTGGYMRVSVIGSEYWSLYQYSRRPKIAPLRQAELTEWYDMICYFNVRAQKLTSVYRTEPTTKKWRKEELKSKDRICRSIGKQSGESVESVLKKKRTATEAKICRKRLYMRMGVVKLQYSDFRIVLPRI